MFWNEIARRAPIDGSGGPDRPDAGRPRRVAREGAGRRPKIGLALGGGAARGWSHIGAVRALAEAGIVPDVIAGCSIGAVVGACHAAAKLDELEAFAASLTKRRVLGLLDFHLGGSGLIAGDRLRRLLEVDLQDLGIEMLPVRFAAIATELVTGHEIWLTQGPLVPAIRASYALPGIFEPVRIGDRWLMDGALVNPVPVTAARALGADLVICVNLNGDLRTRGTVIQAHGPGGDEIVDAAAEIAVAGAVEAEASSEGGRSRWAFLGGMRARMRARTPRPAAPRPAAAPGMAAVMVDAFNITQDRISRSRLAGDPPDVMIAPRLAPVGLFEFHRAAECIALGRRAAERAVPDIREAMEALAAA
jgi:NTE family protein